MTYRPFDGRAVASFLGLHTFAVLTMPIWGMLGPGGARPVPLPTDPESSFLASALLFIIRVPGFFLRSFSSFLEDFFFYNPVFPPFSARLDSSLADFGTSPAPGRSWGMALVDVGSISSGSPR